MMYVDRLGQIKYPKAVEIPLVKEIHANALILRLAELEKKSATTALFVFSYYDRNATIKL